MTFRNLSHCVFGASSLLLASAFLCASAVAQSAAPENSQSSNDTHTPSKTTTSPAQSHPDIFSPSYFPPPKAKHREISAPTLIFSVDPKFPADAPQGKFAGFVVVAMAINTEGKPEQVHVVISLGPEFDKNAVAAAKQYRFRPALRNGKPVPVMVNVEVDFRRY
jgi:TonB family protein